MNILFVDHHDSFSYNVIRLLETTGVNVTAIQHDEILNGIMHPQTPDISHHLNTIFDGIVLSPGPGNPSEYAQTTIQWLKEQTVPVFGICLGLQILLHLTGTIVKPLAIVRPHGRLLSIEKSCYFNRCISGGPFVFYNSLGAETANSEWEILARDPDGIIATIRHIQKPWWGVQFHPESFRSCDGEAILTAFVEYCAELKGKRH